MRNLSKLGKIGLLGSMIILGGLIAHPAHAGLKLNKDGKTFSEDLLNGPFARYQQALTMLKKIAERQIILLQTQIEEENQTRRKLQEELWALNSQIEDDELEKVTKKVAFTSLSESEIAKDCVDSTQLDVHSAEFGNDVHSLAEVLRVFGHQRTDTPEQRRIQKEIKLSEERIERLKSKQSLYVKTAKYQDEKLTRLQDLLTLMKEEGPGKIELSREFGVPTVKLEGKHDAPFPDSLSGLSYGAILSPESILGISDSVGALKVELATNWAIQDFESRVSAYYELRDNPDTTEYEKNEALFKIVALSSGGYQGFKEVVTSYENQLSAEKLAAEAPSMSATTFRSQLKKRGRDD